MAVSALCLLRGLGSFEEFQLDPLTGRGIIAGTEHSVLSQGQEVTANRKSVVLRPRIVREQCAVANGEARCCRCNRLAVQEQVGIRIASILLGDQTTGCELLLIVESESIILLHKVGRELDQCARAAWSVFLVRDVAELLNVV